MPAEIDVDERLRDIAVATLELAREEGPAGVTVRAVAARLGGSTTLVTKYLPSRRALLANAFVHVSAHWDDSKAKALGDEVGLERVRALARWSLQTEYYDDSIRRLWVASLANTPEPVDGDANQREAHDEYDKIRETVAGAGEDEWLADALFLAFRGYYVSSIEDRERWPPERAAAAIERLLDLIEARSDRREPQAEGDGRPKDPGGA